MKKTLTTVSTLLALLLLALTVARCGSSTTPTLSSQTDTLSWVVGQSQAYALQETGVELNPEIVAQAVLHTLQGKSQPLSDSVYMQALSHLNGLIAINQRQKQEETANKEEAYFQQLMGHDNIRQTPEGIYYEVLRNGTGANANPGDIVVFDYRAFFASNGQLYDQTYGNRDAIVHVLGSPMFPGLQIAFTYMNAGSHYRFYIPYRLAFGDKGSIADGIPPYATMVYEVELHEIRR